MLAVQADGSRSRPIEGLTDRGVIADLQELFHGAQRAAVRVLHARHAGHHRRAARRTSPRPSREAIREAISGNYCRCTGYQAIVDAVETDAVEAAARRAKAQETP